MPSYPAKPYVVPQDDWFNNNSRNFENKSRTNGTKNISSIHEFFYIQSDIKVGGSDNHLKRNLEKKSSTKIILSSFKNSDESILSRIKKKYSYSKIPTAFKLVQKRSFKGNSLNKNLTNKNIFNFRSYLLNLKSVFFKIISKKIR